MSFSSWLRNWKASLDRRSALNQTLRRRSSGRRFALRPRLEELEDRTALSTFLVTNTGDNGGVNPAAGAGTGTLRQAIVDADAAATGTAATPDQIQFDISTTDPGYNSTTGTFTIQPLSALPTISDMVVLDGTTQPGFTSTPIIVLDGASAGSGVVGLTIMAGNSTVKGLDINQFSGDGIDLTTNGGNVVEGDYIGTDATGGVALSNGNDGVAISAQNNTIGGTTTAARNVISGNAGGVAIGYSSATGNVVEGDYIGTDATGTAALANGSSGVFIYNGAQNNTIGGTTTPARNVISANAGGGVSITASGTTGNVVEGDYIGTDVTGTKALGNDFSGIYIRYGASNNTIGGATASARNIISGNVYTGLGLYSGSHLVEGNYIGTDATGTHALGNAGNGLNIYGSNGSTIGGTVAGAGNVISGNGNGGGISDGSNNDLIAGNYIGVDASGTVAIPNGRNGIGISGNGDTIGGTAAAARNVISGNSADGMSLYAIGNLVEGNYIGTNAAGTTALGNGYQGIEIDGGSGNTIGGTMAGAGNVISGNNGGYGGILIAYGASNMLVAGNYLGTDVTGANALGNVGGGVVIVGSSNNTIGGTVAAAANIIAASKLYVGTASPLFYNDSGIYVVNAANFYGFTASATGNLIQGNDIGTNAAGSAALGNSGNGITLTAANNTINAGNVIAFNATGVVVQGAGADGNSILGNSIHDNSSLGIQLANSGNDNQAAPVLTSASGSSSGTTVSGTLTSTANTTFRIEFFSNADLDTSGNAEGQTFLGYITVTTDNNGNASFAASGLPAIPAGQGYLTSTATNQSTGDTSQFSNYLTAPTSTVLTSSVNPSLLNQSVTFTATVSSSFGTPTGSVDFVDTTTNTDLGTFALSTSGTASVTVSNLVLGSHVIEATHAGQGLFLGSSATLTQQVDYKFSGFLPPLGSGLTFAVNRTIPIQFTLSDYNGNPITSLSADTSLQIQALDANGNPVGAPFNPVSTNKQGLQYSGGEYQFNWQTKGLAAGSYEIVLKLADGTTHTVTIKLTSNGNGSNAQAADGSDVLNGNTAGQLLGGNVELYVDNSNGALTPDELANRNFPPWQLWGRASMLWRSSVSTLC